MTKLQASLQSETMKKLWQDLEFREGFSKARESRSSKMKAHWSNPEYKARVSAAISKTNSEKPPKNSIAVVIDGVSYPSISAAMRATGRTRYQIEKATRP